MIRLSIFMVLALCFSCKRPAAQEVEAQTISGTVYQTEAYCGGAAPSQQILNELSKPKVLPGKILYFKSGKAYDPEAPVIAEATSNDRGEFSVRLSPGWYTVVDENKKDKASYNYMMSKFAEKSEQYTAVDKKCLDNWVSSPELVFEVKAGDEIPLSINFHKPCSWNAFPCVTFLGQRPR